MHDHFVEGFEVITGEIGVRLGDEQLVASAGDPAISVPVGTVHDWWNASTGITHVRFTVQAAPNAPGRPAARFAESIEVLFSLGALGRVHAHGLPDLLWLAAIAREYRDVVRFVRRPHPSRPRSSAPSLRSRAAPDAIPAGPTSTDPLRRASSTIRARPGSSRCLPNRSTRVSPAVTDRGAFAHRWPTDDADSSRKRMSVRPVNRSTPIVPGTRRPTGAGTSARSTGLVSRSSASGGRRSSTLVTERSLRHHATHCAGVQVVHGRGRARDMLA